MAERGGGGREGVFQTLYWGGKGAPAKRRPFWLEGRDSRRRAGRGTVEKNVLKENGCRTENIKEMAPVQRRLGGKGKDPLLERKGRLDIISR